MKLNLNVSAVFYRNYNSKFKIKANQGGARSSKTWSILQVLIILALESTESKIVTICRKTLAALRVTAMRDFIEILELMNIYDVNHHNKSNYEYRLNNWLFEFQGLDQPIKKRGAKRHKLFINEANELTLEDWRQLTLRTIEDIFLDYNPSDEFHWLYDNILTREDCDFIKSTYQDNPFLEQSIKDEIERLKQDSPNHWRVYGEGERGVSEQIIYKNWEIVNSIPPGYIEIIYGLDFGFVKPSALVRIYIYDDCILLEELIYETRLTNPQLLAKVDECNINKSHFLFADCAEPARITEFSDAGYNIQEADKSVKDGIDHCRTVKIKILNSSVNVIKEIKSYSNKLDKNGNILEEPVKFNDHSMDAFRYGKYTYFLMNKIAVLARFG